mmetsp:Transcript_6262/g.14983  ORF Transcript_6262/g.14983 Transcript_6262/m.14983 type:complete len:448 (-) Transcript_6262:101-1444(-)
MQSFSAGGQGLPKRMPVRDLKLNGSSSSRCHPLPEGFATQGAPALLLCGGGAFDPHRGRLAEASAPGSWAPAISMPPSVAQSGPLDAAGLSKMERPLASQRDVAQVLRFPQATDPCRVGFPPSKLSAQMMPLRSPEVSMRHTAPARSAGHLGNHLSATLLCSTTGHLKVGAPPPMSNSGGFLSKAASANGTAPMLGSSDGQHTLPMRGAGVENRRPPEAIPAGIATAGGGVVTVKQAARSPSATGGPSTSARLPMRSMVPPMSRVSSSFVPAPRFFSYTPATVGRGGPLVNSSKAPIAGTRFLDGIRRPSKSPLLAIRSDGSDPLQEVEFDGIQDRRGMHEEYKPTTSMAPPVTRYVVGQDGCVQKMQDEVKPVVVPAVAAAAMAAVHAAAGKNGLFPARDWKMPAQEAWSHSLEPANSKDGLHHAANGVPAPNGATVDEEPTVDVS